jgi:hypothetical protein
MATMSSSCRPDLDGAEDFPALADEEGDGVGAPPKINEEKGLGGEFGLNEDTGAREGLAAATGRAGVVTGDATLCMQPATPTVAPINVR